MREWERERELLFDDITQQNVTKRILKLRFASFKHFSRGASCTRGNYTGSSSEGSYFCPFWVLYFVTSPDAAATRAATRSIVDGGFALRDSLSLNIGISAFLSYSLANNPKFCSFFFSMIRKLERLNTQRASCSANPLASVTWAPG